MPELPEVETVRRTLEKLIVGETIAAISVGWPKMIKKPDDVHAFKARAEGQSISAVRRRGKFLLIDLEDDVLVSHLRMEGKFAVKAAEEEIDPHVHARFTFLSGQELRYKDVRKFGTLHLFASGEEVGNAPLNKLGPEPFDLEFTADYLLKALNKTSRAVKNALLDQALVAGLGNIYVDESLFHAKIHPLRRGTTITADEAAALHAAVKATLQQALDMGGTSIRSYLNGAGEIGYFQQFLHVYGRVNEDCRVCGTAIERSVVGGRGTHTCPVCQPGL
ncbi:DNA-formamidopyrimidine glycosylase [Salisediminibacterium halotolerans]|uniref:Formamidopyrimidine-DNA glycosylase n=1 Tax=Salisediminibacterium halotolerans TaxID=517425 RepID=A0A1H9U0G8_9BACI|nr:DNA-formamidopyrimidine glycosylase [Salisediminibacterium haloalkalitolerans]SES02691.1 formamidopyrimidine-DNA glycosylase [Salisediminibacterium haloalkalitolerans]